MSIVGVEAATPNKVYVSVSSTSGTTLECGETAVGLAMVGSTLRAGEAHEASAQTKAELLLAKWGTYCEALFRELADQAPAELALIVSRGLLNPAKLTYAAEILGSTAERSLVVSTLLPLLRHSSPVVREGVVYGLAPHLSPEVITRLRAVAEHDPSPAVRTTAREALDGNRA